VDDTGPYNKATVTYIRGLTHDPENAELKDGSRRATDAYNKTPEGEQANERLSMSRAVMADPEVDAIMTDPAMLQVLHDLNTNPAAAAAHMRNPAAAAHMKNPETAAKVQKLVDSGLWY
jgi:stress-induced-phosphoprotein 1